MKNIACLLLPLLLSGCLTGGLGGQLPVNPSGIEGNDFVLECKEKSQTEAAFLCRPVQVL